MIKIPNFSRYLADSEGNIWTTSWKGSGRVKIMKPSLTKGYLKTMLKRDDGKYITVAVHRIIALAYHGEKQFGLEVNHINGIKTDNRPENLEYCSRSYNCKHSFDMGLQIPKKGELNGNSKLTSEQVMEIRQAAKKGGRFYGRKEIANKYGISEAHVKDIVNVRRGIWSHIK